MRPFPVLIACGVLLACEPATTGPGLDSGKEDAGSAAMDGGAPTDGGPVFDAGTPDAGSVTGHPGWARYTVATGAHAATVALNGATTGPLAGLSFATGRTYEFIFTPSAMYELLNPTQPDDQLDWNKLPGLSDCGQVDLSQDGFMFAWRWRLDLAPRVLELAHYANNAGTHLFPAQGLVTLEEADLLAEEPLRFQLSIGGAGNTKYLFHLSGTIRGRAIDVQAEHPRRCASTSPSGLKWAAGFYFGGTSTAPQPITGYVHEPP